MIAWIPLLGRNGLVNQACSGRGLIEQPLEWLLFSDFSVVLAFVHLFTFFMVVPIFNSMMRIDKRLIEAAYDAGATGWQTLVNVIIPLAKPGIVIGSIFVITIVMGDFVTIGVMGGQQIASAGKIIEARLNALQFPRGRGQCGDPARHHDPDHLGADADRRYPQGAVRWASKRSRSFYVLAAFFAAFVLFLYGPMIAIYILSFQGPDGGLTFPMNGVSLDWFGKVFSGAASSTSARPSGARSGSASSSWS